MKPDLFVAIEVNYILRNAIRYCKQQGIPNLVVQHGTPNNYSLHAFVPFEGDNFAAWGEFTKEFLISKGIDKNKIIIAGGVPFDRTLAITPDKGKIAADLNLSPNKKWLVFTTQGIGAGNRPSEEEIFLGITETAKRALEYADYQLIFQVHPSQRTEDVHKIIDTMEIHNSIVTKYKDTEELMAASDGVITFFSTTAIDAVILGKPLLLINLTDDRDFFPFVKMGVAYGAYEKEEIARSFDKLIREPEHLNLNQIVVANYVNYKNDGQALSRIMSLCYAKLNKE
jgi:UDP-N-acetylglucosamine 2-epimerase